MGIENNTAAAEEYAKFFYDKELERVRKHMPHRLAGLTDERLGEFWQHLVDDGHRLAAHIVAKDEAFCSRVEQGLLHPDNKASRRLFERVTGRDLPRTVKGTAAAVAEYCGPQLERYRAARQAERDAEERAEREEREAAERAAIDDAKDRVRRGVPISGEELLTLAKDIGVKVHPRTAGTIRQRLVSVRKGAAKVRGNHAPDNVWRVWQTVWHAIAGVNAKEVA